MAKISNELGKSTLNAEVLNISPHGLWLLVNEKEFFLLFSEFPWFLNATVGQICDVEFYHGKHLHWPELDVDIELDSLEYPQAYPLKYC